MKALWVFLEILLMILLSGEELGCRQNLSQYVDTL
jgi:hypothetical protein